MRRIAILTFHRACNYGAFLQAYALQEYLNGLNGIEAYIIDYRSSVIESRYDLSNWLSKRKTFANLVKFAIDYFPMRKRNAIFEQARSRYYKIKDKNVSRQELLADSYDYDCFITGSDQVWNREIIHEDDTYFLDFVNSPVKKYSYSASIGKDSLTQDEMGDLIKMVENFDAISLREPYSIPDLKNAFRDIRIEWTLDPVFLIGRNEWKKFSRFCDGENYLLFFKLGQGKQDSGVYRFAKKIAKENNLKIVFLSNYERRYRYLDSKHFGTASPEEFVGLIDNASCVICDSFHVTAFSIILHTPFFVETNKRRRNRMINLLELTGLENRALLDGKAVAGSEAPIDWPLVDNKLKKHIENSKEYLKYITTMISEA